MADMPLGLTSALAKDIDALTQFASLSETDKKVHKGASGFLKAGNGGICKTAFRQRDDLRNAAGEISAVFSAKIMPRIFPSATLGREIK